MIERRFFSMTLLSFYRAMKPGAVPPRIRYPRRSKKVKLMMDLYVRRGFEPL
ncbi:MAG: hypothetical protein H5U07_00115 [Candidatus Aminicenantes bacterium]|nr:hypothetical protein [Candidatus Aminicenantes bacterium]